MADPTVTPARTAPASVGAAAGAAAIATWHEGAAYVWGWDGVHTMASPWLYRAFRGAPWPGSPGDAGFMSSLDVRTPGGPVLRPMALRLDRLHGPLWLGRIAAPPGATPPPTAGRDAARMSDAMAWFAAAARLAQAVVSAGRVVPTIAPPVPGDVFAPLGDARWQPVPDAAFDAAVAMLQASKPPIAATAPDVTAAAIVADLVDGVARWRLLAAGWSADLPRDRSAVTVAARSVFKSLTGHDRRLDLPRAVRREDVEGIGRRFHRTGQRAAGRNVVERRVRLVVPEDPLDPWAVVLELVDEADPGRWCTAADVWEVTPLAVEVANGADGVAALGDEVAAFARDVAESVPVARELADQRQPSFVELEVDAAAEFLEQAPEALGRAGIGIIGPEALVRAAVGVRGAASPAPPSDRSGGFGRDTIVQWSLTVADDERTVISDAELARAELTGSTLLHTGRRWVRIDPAALRRARRRLEDYTTLTGDDAEHGLSAMDLLHLSADAAAAGDELGVGDDVAASARDAAQWSGRLLGGLPDDALREEHEPPGFAGELRHYQRRGLGWMRFLARLGLGGCLADDMGLGKTATALAHLLDRPGPHLVVCPLSVVHNWQSRGGPVRAVVARHDPPRRPARRAHRRARGGAGVRQRRAGDHHLRARRPRHRPARPRRLGHGDRRRGAVREEPRHQGGAGHPPAARRTATRPHRHAGGEPAVRAVVDPRLDEPRHARVAGTLPPPLLEADRARRRQRPRRRGGRIAAGVDAAVRAAAHQGRPGARARSARQDRAGRVGRSHPGAGGALPARGRPAARRRRRHDGDEATQPRAGVDHQAQADLQSPPQRHRRGRPHRRALRQAGPLRRTGRRAARRRRAGPGVHPVRHHGQPPRPSPRRPVRLDGAVPVRLRGADPP